MEHEIPGSNPAGGRIQLMTMDHETPGSNPVGGRIQLMTVRIIRSQVQIQLDAEFS